MESDPKLPALLTSIGNQMREALSERLIDHPGELGTGREEIIRQFFRAHLPQRLRVDTGFVFDSHGAMSGQMDLLIYDGFYSPNFHTSGGKLLVPCEAVVCAGQIKSAATSTSVVLGAFENLASVRRLDRTRTERVGGREFGFREYDREPDHLDEIFTFILITGRALSKTTMVELVFDNCIAGSIPWPNVVFAFDRYLVTYACPDGVCANIHHARGVSLISDRPKHELLLRFFLLVSAAAVVTNIWKFSYWDHLYASSTHGATVVPFAASPLWSDDR